MPIHVFFDNSNIWGGAQAVRHDKEPGIPWAAFRIYYRNLFALMENGREALTKVLAGSVPPSCDSLWEYARSHGYDTDLLHRVKRDDGSIGEQGVDEVLHMKIANAVLDFGAPQTLVVATGDGKTSEFGTGFLKQIERALKHGWNVELWSWEPCLNGKYEKLRKTSGGMFDVRILDPYYFSVTFVKEGVYYERDASGAENPINVSERIVDRL